MQKKNLIKFFMQKPPLLRRFLNNDLYNLDNKYSQLLWKVFHGLWTCILMRPFYNILYFFGGQKWGDIMFHGYHREMLYIIGYLLHNGGLAWNKKVMGFLSIFVFFTLPWNSHSICSHSSSLIIIILLFTLVAFAQNSTLQVVCACGT